MAAEEVCEWEDDPEAASQDLKRDSINLSSLECWDYFLELECLKGPQDLQLAAELGKTLLERNKELENNLKQCHNVIDEQAQEIQYLAKQTAALRQTNDHRIIIYEKLDVSIQELERANQRFALDSANDKQQIKTLCSYRDGLEARCEELQQLLDEERMQQSVSKEHIRRLTSTNEVASAAGKTTEANQPGSPAEKTRELTPNVTRRVEDDLAQQLMVQIQELRTLRSRDQREMADLKEEMCRRMQDNAMLEEEVNRLSQREKQVESLQEEMLAREEIRRGHQCVRCLQQVDSKMPQEVQLILDPEEESLSDMEKYFTEGRTKHEEECLELVKKFEAQEEQRNRRRSRDMSKSTSNNCLSLQDELKMYGELTAFSKEEEDEEESDGETKKRHQGRQQDKRKLLSTTPTDFSEAETSSSGFSDETSNKGTQTETHPPPMPGSFLCSIADGEDCKFSIYDDAWPIESRFRKTPEYRTLFREIFAVLKRAAEAKDDGERLPLLDDATPVNELPVPPVTPAKEEAPDLEDLISLPDSVAMSEATSDASSIADFAFDTTLTADGGGEEAGSSSGKSAARPTNDILAYLALERAGKKKSRKRSTNSPARKLKVSEAVERIERSGGGRRRKEGGSHSSGPRPRVMATLGNCPASSDSGSPRGSPWSQWGIQPFVSTAAQEVAKLKKLEKSYAEVLRQTPAKSFHRGPKISASHFK